MPAKVLPRSHPDGRVPLGKACEFGLEAADDELTRVLLRHESIAYVDPLLDWGRRDTVRFLPEAPGRYYVRCREQRTGLEARAEVFVRWQCSHEISGTLRMTRVTTNSSRFTN